MMAMMMMMMIMMIMMMKRDHNDNDVGDDYDDVHGNGADAGGQVPGVESTLLMLLFDGGGDFNLDWVLFCSYKQ